MSRTREAFDRMRKDIERMHNEVNAIAAEEFPVGAKVRWPWPSYRIGAGPNGRGTIVKVYGSCSRQVALSDGSLAAVDATILELDHETQPN